MNDFDNRVASIGRQRAIAFFAPRLAAIALLGVILAVLLAGCRERAPAPGAAAPAVAVERNLYNLPYTVYLYADPDTECQYLMRDGSAAALTPRIAADGKTHMGCKAVAP